MSFVGRKDELIRQAFGLPEHRRSSSEPTLAAALDGVAVDGRRAEGSTVKRLTSLPFETGGSFTCR